MKTFTKYPKCEKHKLLREYAGRVVVSSAALHDHLGGEQYQRFIAGIVPLHEPKVGFWPETVEHFLTESA